MLEPETELSSAHVVPEKLASPANSVSSANYTVTRLMPDGGHIQAPAAACAGKRRDRSALISALSNLGISYGNMANFQAAAQCYLKALSLNPSAGHIWNYLTMTFASMDRPDLVERAGRGDHEAFRSDFDF